MHLIAPRNCMVELVFHSASAYADPYNEVDLDVAFRGPDGGSLCVPGFWAGENVWKARFSGPDEREYTFETTCSNTDDPGLHGVTGEMSVTPYAGENELLRRGRLRVAADKRHFEHADGTPFFWVGDTWWMGLCSRMDWPEGFQWLAADRAAKGFSVIQIIAGPYPDMDAWDPRGRSDAGFPFSEGFDRVNPAYFDLADLKIGYLVRSGLVPCIVGMWGYYLPQLGVERVRRFWRYLVARYAAYPVVWCICGEGLMPYYLSKTPEADVAAQREGWTEVMRSVRETDGFHNLITIHPTQFGREQVADPSLMDFEMLQTGHGDRDSIVPTATTVDAAMSREPKMPVIVAEVNYEGIGGHCWQNIQRMAFYAAALRGTAGHTYGANGIWQASTAEQPYGPSPHGHCWGNTPWREAAQLPGSRQIGLGGAFMRRFQWWELRRDGVSGVGDRVSGGEDEEGVSGIGSRVSGAEPEIGNRKSEIESPIAGPESLDPNPDTRHPIPQTWTDPPWSDDNPYSPTACGIPGKLRIIYKPLVWDFPRITSLEQGVAYTAYYFNPCTGADVPIGPVTPDASGSWQPPIPPEGHDWVLVMQAVPGQAGAP